MEQVGYGRDREIFGDANERARIIFDNMPLGCHLWDSGVRMIDCNKAALRLYGFKDKREQIENFHTRSPECQPDGQNSALKSRMLIQKTFEEGRHSEEWMHRAADGSPMPVELTLARLRCCGSDIVAAYTRDLREIKRLEANVCRLRDEEEALLREANERVKIMLDATPLGCHLWNSRLELIDCNEASVKLYGYGSRQEQLDNFDAGSPEYQPDGQLSGLKARGLLMRTFAEGRGASGWVHRAPDGTPVPVELDFVRVRYGDDYVVAVYARDLRDIRRMEADILRLESEAGKIYCDPLTGIRNRRFLDESLGRIVQSLSLSGGTLGLLMIDIDFFKRYNDAHGHAEGDVCLQAVARALQGSLLRGEDFAARYGGEEFAVVLPGTDEEGARMIADRLLESVRGCAIAHGANDAADCVTVSIGVAAGRVGHGQSGRDFIVRADEMLYKAKREGRNRYAFGSLACAL